LTIKIPLGMTDFLQLRREQAFFVDKSAFIAEIWRHHAQVLLLPRPRRFGKTLNLSMLRYFFEVSEEPRRDLFHHLAVADDREVMAQQGRYPVVFLTFKDVKQKDFDACFEKLRTVIAGVYKRHRDLLDSAALSEEERAYYRSVLAGQASATALESSLEALTAWLHRAYGQAPILLLDEYDAPIHAGFRYGYYEQVISFLRNFLSGGFKDNAHLKKGVLSGVLRVAKESIFSGLNNLTVHSLLHRDFEDAFGFSEQETRRGLAAVGREGLLDTARSWYGGYRFGERTVFNPWSVLNLMAAKDAEPQTFWINTSDNALARDLLLSPTARPKFETLLGGGAIVSPVNESLSFRELNSSADHAWSLLAFSGYLRVAGRKPKTYPPIYRLTVPNFETMQFFRKEASEWARARFGENRLINALEALTRGDVECFSAWLREMVAAAASYHDIGAEPEAFYHAFMLGLLTYLADRYEVRSNREAGYGRYDVALKPIAKARDWGVVFEFKKMGLERERKWEDAMANALRQIRDKRYARELVEANVANIMEIGIVFTGKDVHVRGVHVTSSELERRA